MRLIVLALVGLFAGRVQAQPQLWGYTYGAQEQLPGSPFPNGGLFRLDQNGMDPEFLLSLDTNGIRWPWEAMVLGSNGKIYAAVPAASQGGPEPRAHIWEYDPVLDSLTIVHRVEDIPFVTFMGDHRAGLSGSFGNKVFGLGYRSLSSDPQYGNSIPLYSYDVVANTIQEEASIPGYFSLPQWYTKYINGGITVLPDGRLLVAEASSRVLSGALGIADPATNSYSQVYTMDQFHAPDGYNPNGPLVESGGLYYSTTFEGAFAFEGIEPFLEHGYGTIFSYDLTTNTYSKLHEFSDPLTGYRPFLGLVKHTDGLLYGLAAGGINVNGTESGVLYSFDPQNGTYTVIQDFGQTPLGTGTSGILSQLISASNGKIYGSVRTGIYEYDPTTENLNFTTGLNVGYGNQGAKQLLEICRKPNYKSRPTTNFTVCNGSYFAYDLRNVNATSVVWRRNGIVVPSQIDQRLEFEAISSGDAGIWSCTLSNECGVTEPQPITITVNPGSGFTPTITGPEVLCGPTGSIVLTGNINGGTWPGGATTQTLTVTEPGLYQVHQVNACGSTFSNIIEVVRISLPDAPEPADPFGFPLPADTIVFCPEFGYMLHGNGPGVWNDIPVGVWHAPLGHPDEGSTSANINADLVGDYYLTVTNACGSDTSRVIEAVLPDPWPQASISALDAFGVPSDLFICAGDSVLIRVNYPDPIYALYQQDLGYVADGAEFVIKDSAHYYIVALGPCAGQVSDTLWFQVQVDEAAPVTPAVILPENQPTLIGCDQDSTYLNSLYPNSIWRWTDASGEIRNDTTDQILIDWSIGGNGTYQLVNFNGCGDSPADQISIEAVPSPEVTFTVDLDTLCYDAGSVILGPGSPPTGTFSGNGVSGEFFDPVAAGTGGHVIIYSYNDGVCTGFAQDTIHVDLCLSTSSEVGQGGVLLFPNPNNGRFDLAIEAPFTHGSLRICSADGRSVGHGMPLRSGRNSIGAGHLSPGVYFAWVCIDDAERVIRFEVL